MSDDIAYRNNRITAECKSFGLILAYNSSYAAQDLTAYATERICILYFTSGNNIRITVAVKIEHHGFCGSAALRVIIGNHDTGLLHGTFC